MTRTASPTVAAELNDTSSRSGRMLRALTGYRPIAELGAGGMASVYLVVAQGQGGVNKLLVLKAIRSELAADPQVVKMFLDEARVAAQLNHPNVVQTYEVGNWDGRSVLIMEYLEGQSLARLLSEYETRGRQVPLAVSLRIAIAVLEGLHYVHELKGYDGASLDLVHRDISPQNVFVTYDGQVKILDFGIAKARSSSSETGLGVVKGKFAYMPPEQMRGESVDRRADIYSVGCMLWAAVAGEKLWKGVPDPQIVARVIHGDIPPLRERKPGCDPELLRIIEKAMAADREQRYSTALELQIDLEWYCDKLGNTTKPKEIGKLMSDMFVDTRAKVRRLIESQLAALDAGGGEDITAIPVSDDQSRSRSAPRSPVPAADSSTTSTQPGRNPLAKWFGWGTALGLALLAALVIRSYRSLEGNAPATPSSAVAAAVPPLLPAAEPAPQLPAPPAAASAAMIRFDVRPAGARLFLDGTPLAKAGDPRSIPIDGTKHTLRGEAPGYRPEEVEFTVIRDATIELQLAKAGAAPRGKPAAASAPRQSATPAAAAPAAAAPAAAAPAAPAAAAPAAAPAAPPARSCSDPFYIAPGGIKRVRPECL